MRPIRERSMSQQQRTVVEVPRHSSPQPQPSRVLVAVGLARQELAITAAPHLVPTWAALAGMWAAAHACAHVWTGLVVCGDLLHGAHKQSLRRPPQQLVTAVPAWACLQMRPAALCLPRHCHADTAACLRSAPASPCSPLRLKLPHGAALCLQCSRDRPGSARLCRSST